MRKKCFSWRKWENVTQSRAFGVLVNRFRFGGLVFRGRPDARMYMCVRVWVFCVCENACKTGMRERVNKQASECVRMRNCAVNCILGNSYRMAENVEIPMV